MWLYENKNNLISMGNNGYRFVVEKYNWDTAEKNLINLYERFLKQTDVSNIT